MNKIVKVPHKSQFAYTRPDGINEELQIDFMGPMIRTPRGFKYILSMIDSYDGYCRLVPCVGCDTLESVQALKNRWFYALGLVENVKTDNGPAFANSVNDVVSKIFGYNTKFSTTYYPQSQGVVERLNKKVKYCLSIVAQEAEPVHPELHVDWDLHLDAISFLHNTTIYSTTKVAPWILRHGRSCPDITFMLNSWDKLLKNLNKNKYDNPMLFKDLDGNIQIFKKIKREARKNVLKYYNKSLEKWNETDQPKEYFKKDDFVMVKIVHLKGNKKKFTRKYNGPFKVIGINTWNGAYQLMNKSRVKFWKNNKYLKKVPSIQDEEYFYDLLNQNNNQQNNGNNQEINNVNV